MSRRASGLLLALLGVAPLLASASRGDEPRWYGGIEIGSKGVKVIALPVDDDGRPDLNRQVKKLPHKEVNNVTLGDLKDGKFRAEAIEEAEAAVKDFYEQLTQVGDARRPKLAPGDVWIVASSGLRKDLPTNYAELEAAVKRATGDAKTLISISQKREVELLMRGAIPRDQWDNAMIVDVGNGSTKFGYLKSPRPPEVEQAFVPNLSLKGTGTTRKAIEGALKVQHNENNFRLFCAFLKDGRPLFLEEVADEIGRHPGLINSQRTRVYLSGGSPYAVASMLYPVPMIREDVQEVRLSLKDLRKFRDEMADAGKLPKPDLKGIAGTDLDRVNAQLRDVRDIFQERDIFIGADIILNFDEVLHWEQDQKEIYFTKAGLVAWIAGFVVEERARPKVDHVSGQ